jgi:hypothetical protein
MHGNRAGDGCNPASDGLHEETLSRLRSSLRLQTHGGRASMSKPSYPPNHSKKRTREAQVRLIGSILARLCPPTDGAIRA